MNAAIWIWQFMQPVTPAQAEAAVKAAGLGDDWIPVVPFAEVTERAVGTIKGAKRTKEPGLIIWEHKGRSWFADLVAETLEFESPKSKLAKEIAARVEAAMDLQPRDLGAYLEDVVRGWGGVQLMGPLWIVPEADGSSELIAMLRGLPGAAVAAIPIEGPAVAGEVLALMAGRMAGEAETMAAGLDGLRPETIRRRAGIVRGYAEDVAALAEAFGVDLWSIGHLLTDTEDAIRSHMTGQHYAAPLDFGGGSSPVDAHHKPEQKQQPEPYRSHADAHPIPDQSTTPAGPPGSTYTKIGDPPAAPPPLKSARPAEVEK